MASEFFGINRGQLDGPIYLNVTVGSSTGATDIELRVDTGKGSTKKDVIVALRAFEHYLLGQGGALGTVGIPPL
jgi:hypothetical protein